MLGNPVPGHIQARGETWAGVGKPIVTSTYQEHKASGRALGIDIGLGRIGDPVYAMESGQVNFAGGIIVTGMPSAALVVRIRHPQLDAKFGGKAVVSGYAHLNDIKVSSNATVTRGQLIGHVGMTGATAPHLHGGFTVAGTEIDWWPLLDQNAGGDGVTETTITLFKDGPHTMTIPAGGKVDGWTPTGTAPAKSQTFATGSSFPADGSAVIKQTPARAPQGTFYRCTAGVFAGLFVPVQQVKDAGAVNPPAAGGFTQADLDKAYNEGRGAVQGAAASVPPR